MPYTPGPWTTDAFRGTDEYEDPDTPIVVMSPPTSGEWAQWSPPKYYWSPNIVSIPAGLQQASDAKLMAAAPIMLKTLKATLVELQSLGETVSDATIRRIKAAIEEAQYDWDE
jgi:hypothetical protein